MSLEIIQLNNSNYVPDELLERLGTRARNHEVADILVPSASHVGHAQKAIATQGAGIGAGVMVYTPRSYVAKYWPLITDGTQIATKAQIEVYAAEALEEARERIAATVEDDDSDDFIYHLNKIGVIAEILMRTTLERIDQVLDGSASSTSSSTSSSTPNSVPSSAQSSVPSSALSNIPSSIPSKTPSLEALTENEGIIISVALDTLLKLHEAHLITQEEAAGRLVHNQDIELPPLFITGFEQADENLIRFIKALAVKTQVTYFSPGTKAGRILASALSEPGDKRNPAVERDDSARPNFNVPFAFKSARNEGAEAQNAQDAEQCPLPRLVFLEPLGPSAEAESIAAYLKTYTATLSTVSGAPGEDANDAQNTASPSLKTKGSHLKGASKTQAQLALVVTTDPERAWRTLAPKLADTMVVHASWSKPLLSCKPVALFLRFVEQLWDIMESQKEWEAFATQWEGIGEWEAFVARWKGTAEKKPTNREILQFISADYAALPSAWWPPTDIVDFLHGSLSPFEAQDVDAFDASMRSRRNLKPDDVLEGLKSIQRGSSWGGQDPQHDFSLDGQVSQQEEVYSAQDEEAQRASTGNPASAEEERRNLLNAFNAMHTCLSNFDLKGAIEALLPIAAKDDSKESLQGMTQLYSLMLAVQPDQTSGAEETKAEKARAKEAHRQLELLIAMARNASLSYSYQATPTIRDNGKAAISSDLDASDATVDIVSYNSAASILPKSYDMCVLADQGMEAQTTRMYLTSVERLINEKLGDAEQVPREIVSAARNEHLCAIARDYVAFEKPQKTDEGREVYPSPLLSSVEAAFRADSNDSKNVAAKGDACGKDAPLQEGACGKEASSAAKETAVSDKGTLMSGKETADSGKDALESYKQELVKTLGPWVQQSEEHVRQNYLAQDNHQVPHEYPFEEAIRLTGKAKELLGRAKVPNKRAGKVSLTEEVCLSPTSLEALRACPRKWFFERGLTTQIIDAEMDALARGTLYHDVVCHVLEGATSAQGKNHQSEDGSGRYTDLYDEVWTKRFAQAMTVAGGANINLPNKDAAELALMNDKTEQTDGPGAPSASTGSVVEAPAKASGVHEQNIAELFENFYNFLPKSLQETQIVRDMDQNLHRLLESGEVFVEGFQPAFFEYPFDSTTEQDSELTYAGTGQRGSIDRIDIDENGNVLIIDYKSSKKDSLAQYKLGVDKEDGSIKTESYLHPQTFIYAQVINKLKPRLKTELEASALPHTLKEKLKQKELKVVGVLYLGVADWQAFYGCAEEGALPAQITQESASGNVTAISAFDSLVDSFEARLGNLVAEKIGKGILPPDPLGDGKGVCEYCAFKYKCAFDMRKKEAEIEKYAQWSQLHAEKDAKASPETGVKTSPKKTAQESAQGESNA